MSDCGTFLLITAALASARDCVVSRITPATDPDTNRARGGPSLGRYDVDQLMIKKRKISTFAHLAVRARVLRAAAGRAGTSSAARRPRTSHQWAAPTIGVTRAAPLEMRFFLWKARPASRRACDRER